MVELLVVIAIIGILVALLLPAIQAAREAARRTSCLNNMKQLGLALTNYHDTNRAYPPGADNSSGKKGAAQGQGCCGFPWSSLILPFIEAYSLYGQVDFDYGPNFLENAEQIRQLFPFYQCPSAPDNELIICCSITPGKDDAGESNYGNVATFWPLRQALTFGNKVQQTGILFDNYDDSRIQMKHVTDGTSHTMIVAETDYDQDDPWKNPQCPNGCFVGKDWATLNALTTAHGINSWLYYNDAPIQSHHPGGAHSLFADGHVEFLDESINQQTLDALGTRAGGEVIADY